ncbi:MAG: 4Fe-4S dicluster domain-containing protein [Candidatus Aminicenantaceae bacterium]
MEKILPKISFPHWVKKLTTYAIYAPVNKDDLWNYELTDNLQSIDLDYLTTVLSLKKIIFPQREILLEFNSSNEEGIQVTEVLPEERPAVIFGVRPCDAKALTLMDKVFGGDFEDLYYFKRRNSTILVGLTCSSPPSPNCFCLSVDGSPHSKDGLDILMTDLGDKYIVESLTQKGNQLINAAKEIFQTPKEKDKKDADKIKADSEKKIKRQITGIKKIPPKLKEMFEVPFWNEESLSCIRCGICTYLCPTCHCFDINDEVTTSSPLKGKRVRTWDNCQFPDFTMHSSGHNPRPDRSSRLRQRILHKFQYFVERYKSYQCTGCGRCVSKCPVGIDIIEVLSKVSDNGP